MARKSFAGVAALVLLFAGILVPVAAAASAQVHLLSVDPDGRVSVGELATLTLSLPAGAAAVDGRILVAPGAAEAIGVVPVGSGIGLRPTETDGGYVFGAYGLESGAPQIQLVVNPEVAGRIQVRIVVDDLADQAGSRIDAGGLQTVTTIVAGQSNRVYPATSGGPRGEGRRGASRVRDILRDGKINSRDLDTARANWSQAQGRGGQCGVQSDADANDDGCVDIVDIQAVYANENSTATGLAAVPAAVTVAVPHTFTVTNAGDTPDAAPGDAVCADSAGHCTLRAAINEAEFSPGNDRIEFNLPGTAPVRIQLTGPLPIITSLNGTLTIDGYTQPGSSTNTLQFGSNAVLGVELHGNGEAAHEVALYITSPGNTVRGLIINNVYRAIAIDGSNAHDNLIVGNWIGFLPDQSPSAAQAGIVLDTASSNNRVGTPALADRNVIGNWKKAIDAYGPGNSGQTYQNNLLCIRPDGSSPATCDIGIDHDFGPKNDHVGGSGLNERNIIGPTYNQGIEYSHGWNPADHSDDPTYRITGNSVIGNWIGFKFDGNYDPAYRSGIIKSLGDNGNGINVYDGSSNNLVEGNYIGSNWDGIQFMAPNANGNTARNNVIGVSPLGQPAPLAGWGFVVRWGTQSDVLDGNTIRNAGKGGVGLLIVMNDGTPTSPAFSIRITKNIISDTNGPAIDLFGIAGPDPNDVGDADAGSNTVLNTPVITSALLTGVSGTATRNAIVEVYRASRPADQFGLPIEFLGSTVVAPDGSWTVALALTGGGRVTALQILPDGTTSELSANVALPNSPPVIDSVVISPSSPTSGQVLTANVTSHDPDVDTITTTYQWIKNGVDIAGATGSTLNLATAGNGDRGDQIAVRVTVNDGTVTSAPTTSSPVTVVNFVPTVVLSLVPANPGSNATAVASIVKTDTDGDSVSVTWIWKVNGSPVRTFTSSSALSDSLNLAVAGNGDAGDTLSVEVTPNDGIVNGTTATASQVVVPGPTVYASDTFARTVSGGWGTANYGGAYTLLNTASDFSVSSGTGKMVLPTGGSLRSASLADVSVRDSDFSFRFAANKVPGNQSEYIYAIARRTSASNAYRIKVRVAPTGAVLLQASSVVNNAEATIGSEVQVPGLTLTANSFIRVRAQLSGTNPTTIRIRAWVDGGSEPSTWQYTATNSTAALQTSGGVGLMTYVDSAVSNTPVTITFDDLLVTGIEGGPANTAPVVDTVSISAQPDPPPLRP